MGGKGVQIYVWMPEYYKYLYEELFKEIERIGDFSVPKWKKDILLLLLKLSESPRPNNPNVKVLRREINRRVEKIVDKAWAKESEEIKRGS